MYVCMEGEGRGQGFGLAAIPWDGKKRVKKRPGGALCIVDTTIYIAPGFVAELNG